MAREGRRKREARRFGTPDRLADLVHGGVWGVPHYDADYFRTPEGRQAYAAYRDDFLESVKDSVVVCADNVAEFFYAGTPKEDWETTKDFPSCVPPLPSMFVEMKRPSCLNLGGKVVPSHGVPELWGWLIECESREAIVGKLDDAAVRAGKLKQLGVQLGELFPLIDRAAVEHVMRAARGGPAEVDPLFTALGPVEQTFLCLAIQYHMIREGVDARRMVSEDTAWVVTGRYVLSADGRLFLPGQVRYEVRPDGFLRSHPVYPVFKADMSDREGFAHIRDICHASFLSVLMTVSFMNCKNVTLATVDPDPAVNRLRRREGRRPFVRYHTIDIEPMKHVLRTEGDAEAVGLKRALHICRGHFATYTEDRPLFGRVAGTFWKAAHVRGSAGEGVVISDYNVKAPGGGPAA
jgi:hypothetical protein